MNCKLCGGKQVNVIYKGQIRNGGLGKYTKAVVPIYQCTACNVIWHENEIKNIDEYYESQEYRQSLEGSSEEKEFYRLHDKESMDKFSYTGTTIFRDKVVADIGCGCGAFLDFLSGVAKEIVAIEPSETYRKIMDRKGYHTFPYADEATTEYKEKIDVITSFDVIEHVEDPQKFLADCYELLKMGGQAIIGTPTDAPVMRQLLGDIYEKKLLFSTQHLWIFSEKNLKMVSKNVGFWEPEVKYYQRYGIGNMIGWIKNEEACSEIQANFLTKTLDSVWKSECEQMGMSDYVVLYLKKGTHR